VQLNGLHGVISQKMTLFMKDVIHYSIHIPTAYSSYSKTAKLLSYPYKNYEYFTQKQNPHIFLKICHHKNYEYGNVDVGKLQWKI
jgi:hypothetical protein